MKKLQLLLVCLLLASANKAEQLIEVMRMVNTEVNHQTDLPHNWQFEQVHPASFTEAITIHLLHVEEVLALRTTEHLNQNQIKNRFNLLKTLHNYALAGKFPQNTHYSFQTPIFIDDFNTHCAVGYLMQQSGSENLAKKISNEQNLAYVKEINVEGVAQWANEHGFSLDELAWIQPGYPPATVLTPLLNGVNGTVYSIAEYQGQLYAAGSFDTADVSPANNIATYISGFAGWLWTEVDGGTNGPIRKLFEFNGDLIAAGDFSSAGGVNARSVAKLHNGQWEAMGEGLNGIVYDLEVFNGSLYAFGDFEITGSDTNGEDVAIWNGSAWDDVGLVTNGAVYAAHATDMMLHIAGNFSVCGGITTNNIASYNGFLISTPGEGIPAPVYDVIEWNGTLTAATKIKQGLDTLGVMQFNNGNWDCLPGVRESVYADSTAQFKSLLIYDDELYVTGKFFIESFMIYGSGVARWTNSETYPEPLTFVLDTVFTSIYLDDYIIGGDFHIPQSTPVNAIAKVENFTTSNNTFSKSNKSSLIAYPNPSNSEKIKFINADNLEWLRVYDLQGKFLNQFDKSQIQDFELPGRGMFIVESNRGDHLRLLRN
jgi:hypothetical protein